jgi:hypothetical protein
MKDVTPESVRVMAEAAGLAMSDDDAVEVAHRINAFLIALAPLGTWSLDRIPPLPVDPSSR